MGTIKGLFIKMQINRLKQIKGADSVKELEKLYGKSVDFNAFESYPTSVEEKIIKECLRLVNPAKTYADLAFEAGRFHIQTFLESPYGVTLLTAAPKNLKDVLNYASVALKSIIQESDIRFSSTGEKTASIVMKNTGYTMKHFEGMWTEILDKKYAHYQGKVSGTEVGADEYEYSFIWK